MNRLILICLFTISAIISKAQKADSVGEAKAEEEFNTKIFTAVEQEPQFPGGINGFNRYLGNNLIYPAKASQKNIKGKVAIYFIVERDGSLSGFKIDKSLSAETDAEALRLMRNSPNWIAGMQNGKPTRVAFTALIQFPQDAPVIPKDTSVFYIKTIGSSEQVVKTKDSADFYRVVLPPDTSIDKYLLIVNEFYKNGKKKMIGDAFILNHQLLLAGMSIEFFENGKRSAIKNYVDGALFGEFSNYYPNGKLYLAGKYDRNGNMIINESGDSTGKVIATGGAGHFIRYTNDFKKIIEEGPIVNGVEEGEWQGSENGTVIFTHNYKNGIYQGGRGADINGNQAVFRAVDVEPTFTGGIEAFYKYLRNNMRYPDVAKKNNVQGKVSVSFIVEKDGTLSNVRVARGAGSGLDEEAVRIIKNSPKWQPGMQNRVPVRVKYTMPISFVLQSN